MIDLKGGKTMSTIRLHQLEGFFHVARLGGYTKATQAFSYPIGQPAVYQQVRGLQEDLELTDKTSSNKNNARGQFNPAEVSPITAVEPPDHPPELAEPRMAALHSTTNSSDSRHARLSAFRSAHAKSGSAAALGSRGVAICSIGLGAGKVKWVG